MTTDIAKLRKECAETGYPFCAFTSRTVIDLLDEIERLRVELKDAKRDAEIAKGERNRVGVEMRREANLHTAALVNENEQLKSRCHALANVAATSDLNKGKP